MGRNFNAPAGLVAAASAAAILLPGGAAAPNTTVAAERAPLRDDPETYLRCGRLATANHASDPAIGIDTSVASSVPGGEVTVRRRTDWNGPLETGNGEACEGRVGVKSRLELVSGGFSRIIGIRMGLRADAQEPLGSGAFVRSVDRISAGQICDLLTATGRSQAQVQATTTRSYSQSGKQISHSTERDTLAIAACQNEPRLQPAE